MTHLFGESDLPQDAIRAGQTFIKRYSETEPTLLPSVHRQIALNALRTGEQGINEAIQNFEASITNQTPPVEKIDSFAQLILLLGIERKQVECVPQLLEQVAQTAKKSDASDDVKSAYRRAVNAAGDVSIWHGNRPEALEYYRRVEALAGQFIPSQVRAARVGAYPRAIREYIAMGNFGAALPVYSVGPSEHAGELHSKVPCR